MPRSWGVRYLFCPRTGSKRVWRASLDRQRGISEAGELDLSRPRTRIDRRRGLPGFPLFGPAVAQQLAAGFEQSSCSSTATAITLTADLSRRWRAGLASQRCVFVQDASDQLPRVKTADLASGTLFGSSVGMDDRYDFER